MAALITNAKPVDGPADNAASDDLRFMREALDEAAQAALHGDVPVGAVVTLERDGATHVARAHNRREADADPTAHAEVLALRKLAAAVNNWNLDGATLYVTQEPCPMCAGALVNARVRRLVYGCGNPKAGAVRTLFRLADDPRLNHRVKIVGGVFEEECGALLTSFFRSLRQRDR